MAMAGARFAESLLKAAQGQKGVVEPTFVDSPLYKGQGIDFFASKVELGPNGIEKIHEVGKISEHEQKLLDACLADLKKNIAKGKTSPHRYSPVGYKLIFTRCRIRQTKPLDSCWQVTSLMTYQDSKESSM
jgi:hypothetical protein